MFHRMTDRACMVMGMARSEALALGAVSTEHMLLALIQEGRGVAANVLARHGLTLKDISLVRDKVLKITGSRPAFIARGELRLTPRVKSSLNKAWDWAAQLKHNYIGTEHLLLGLLDEPDGAAYATLVALGVNPRSLQQAVFAEVGFEDQDHGAGSVSVSCNDDEVDEDEEVDALLSQQLLSLAYDHCRLIEAEELLRKLHVNDDRHNAARLRREALAAIRELCDHVATRIQELRESVS